MIIVEAPNESYSIKNELNKKVFIAGGITNCPDWQSLFITYIKKYEEEIGELDLTVFNPRRNEFDITNPSESEKQIVWEHRHLEESDIIMYWFSSGSINPIVLYELGKYVRSGKDIIIGIDPEYSRKKDVILQSRLAGYKSEFSESIENLIKNVIQHI